MALKAEISQPSNGSTLPAGGKTIILGAAWGGNVQKVEVSADGGKSWRAAELNDGEHSGAWRRWRLEGTTPAKAGAVTLMARAFDEKGQTQPAERDASLG